MPEPAPDDSPPVAARPDPAAPPPAPNHAQVRRQVAEFLIMMLAGMLVLRYFVAEAYVVPTGSMAPTILGFHCELDCPNCRDRFSVGVDEAGRLAGRPVCPNCGQDGFDVEAAVEAGGDRLLVQKFLFDLRGPRRWEVAVFQSPIEPDQAYVKRVVALPGEAVQVIDGDVWVDGAIARKTLDEVRATKIPVFDNEFQPRDANRFPRWRFRGDRSRRSRASGWEAAGTHFVRKPVPGADAGEDWLEYRHWDPDRGQYGPIHDSYPYNGGDQRGGNVVRDVLFECAVSPRADVGAVQVRVAHGADLFRVVLPVDGKGRPELLRNGRVLELSNAGEGLRSSPADRPRWSKVEVAVVDRRVSVAVDGRMLFDPVDYELGGPPIMTTPSPVALGVVGGSVEVKDLRLFRDIYYTGELAARGRRPSGVDEPYFLGADEYFVLGDNSPVSNDSRFWDGRPVVRRGQLLGKPFLVHLPGRAWGIRLFGRELGWIPDFREIRYIR